MSRPFAFGALREARPAASRKEEPKIVLHKPAGGDPFVVRNAAEADMPAVHEHLRPLCRDRPRDVRGDGAEPRRDADCALARCSISARPTSSPRSGGEIVGYCYAASYHARPAYRHTIEDFGLCRDGLGGRGVGAALLGELIARCEAGPGGR